jgi:hypothetical protein
VVTMLIARLHPPGRKEGVRYNGLYCVEFDGELIIVGSRDPEHDLARALVARGLTGKVTMLDAKTGKPRAVIDIAKAAELCVSEESRDGLRIRKYRGSRIAHRPRPKMRRSFRPCPHRRTRLHESASSQAVSPHF